MSASALIGIDWGTSAARAYRIGPDGGVLEARSATLGIQKLADRRFADALAELLGPWRDDPAPRLACGMIGSRQGWREAPYVGCPATVDALAAGIVVTAGGELAIVPGVISRDSAGMPDVMRGEETQVVGAIDGDAASVLAVLPGTHSKWTRVEHGRLVDFQTYMTGELYSVLLEHSILGRLAERGTRRAGPGRVRAGRRAGRRRGRIDARPVRRAHALPRRRARSRRRRGLALGPADRARDPHRAQLGVSRRPRCVDRAA